MSLYFNELDPYPAQWLRNLWPTATVDERSIKDVSGSDVDEFRWCHFFAGVGGWQEALRLAQWPRERPVWTGSCPCQPFSSAGQKKGHRDKRHLWPEFRRLIKECRPATVFGEQVASPAGRRWLARVRADLEALGYAVGASDLCAAGVGAPHVRQRLFWVADLDGSGRANTERREGSAAQDGWTFSTARHFEDGTHRRAPQPDVRIVADGIQANPPCVRAYGNAIVPQIAAVFIRAFLGSCGCSA